MFDERDSDCPECGQYAAGGDCRCAGGDLMRCGVERFEFRELGRERARLTVGGDRGVVERDVTPRRRHSAGMTEA